MLSNINFDSLELVSSAKNINDIYDYKDILVTMTFLRNEDSISHLTGIEELVARLDLEEKKKYIKLSASYSIDSSGSVLTDRPIKVIFTDINNKYKKVAHFEREVDDVILSDVEFINMVFDRSPVELKRIFM